MQPHVGVPGWRTAPSPSVPLRSASVRPTQLPARAQHVSPSSSPSTSPPTQQPQQQQQHGKCIVAERKPLRSSATTTSASVYVHWHGRRPRDHVIFVVVPITLSSPLFIDRYVIYIIYCFNTISILNTHNEHFEKTFQFIDRCILLNNMILS